MHQHSGPVSQCANHRYLKHMHVHKRIIKQCALAQHLMLNTDDSASTCSLWSARSKAACSACQ